MSLHVQSFKINGQELVVREEIITFEGYGGVLFSTRPISYSLKQQFTRRHTFPLGYIILIQSQPTFKLTPY
jgi:hypothetical protein